MTQQFHALGVSDAVCDVLSARGYMAPFEIQAMVIPEGAPRRRRARQEPDRLR